MAHAFIQPSTLLALAADLGGETSGPGRPRPIYLRRAVSSAYYAVFHRLTQHSAQQLLGRGEWTLRHSAVARWITHTDLAALADAANNRGNASLRAVLAPVDARLQDVAQNFLDLQSARHSADYDDFYEVSRSLALSHVASARAAVAGADALFTEEHPGYLRFLALAFGSVKVAKSRSGS